MINPPNPVTGEYDPDYFDENFCVECGHWSGSNWRKCETCFASVIVAEKKPTPPVSNPIPPTTDQKAFKNDLVVREVARMLAEQRLGGYGVRYEWLTSEVKAQFINDAQTIVDYIANELRAYS